MATSNRIPDTIEIQLTRGQVAIIDAIDADLASSKWYAQLSPRYTGGGKFLAARGVQRKCKNKTYLMHRVILARMIGRDLEPHEKVDHIDGDTLNNQRENLRLATNSQNMCNRGKQANNTSGYKGVSWHKPTGRWQAVIKLNGILRHLGRFDDPEDAARTYDAAAIRLHGEFARLNFPLTKT